MKWIVLGLVIYVGGAIITFGAMNATDQWDCHHRWNTICDARMVRGDRVFAVFAAVLPPGWLAALVITAGYGDGISFSAEPHLAAMR